MFKKKILALTAFALMMGPLTLCAQGTAIEMVRIPGGTFTMGSNDGLDYFASPPHRVTLSTFSLGKYPVTQEQWQAVMGTNPSYFQGTDSGRRIASGEVQGRRPVEMVSWYDAVVFCNKLSMAEGLSPAYRINGSTNPGSWGSVPVWPERNNSIWDAVIIIAGSTGYRLPTEAQWEYAAKGGNGSPGNYLYSGSNTAGDVGWYEDNSDGRTHEVGKKRANGLGLHDMSGNVWEWCWDWSGDYTNTAKTDPVGASAGTNRVTRGGGWSSSASYLRSVYRIDGNPYYRYDFIGFRLARP